MWGIFDPYFLFFFSKNNPLKSEFLVSMNRTVSKRSLHQQLRANISKHKVMALGVVKLLIFNSFSNFLNILENYPAIFEILVEFKERVREALLLMGLIIFSRVIIFSTAKVMTLGKLFNCFFF